MSSARLSQPDAVVPRDRWRNGVDAKTVTMAQKAWSSVILAGVKGEKPNKTDPFADLDWSKDGGSAVKYNRAYRDALSQDRTEIEPGKQGAKLHKPGRRRPDDDQFGLKIGDVEEDDDE